MHFDEHVYSASMSNAKRFNGGPALLTHNNIIVVYIPVKNWFTACDCLR